MRSRLGDHAAYPWQPNTKAEQRNLPAGLVVDAICTRFTSLGARTARGVRPSSQRGSTSLAIVLVGVPQRFQPPGCARLLLLLHVASAALSILRFALLCLCVYR
jgi:hypothetical protein